MPFLVSWDAVSNSPKSYIILSQKSSNTFFNTWVNAVMLVSNKLLCYVVVVDLPLLGVAVEGSDNPVSLEKPCQASLPPDQQGRHSLGRQPEVQYIA